MPSNAPPPSILLIGAGELGAAVLSALASHPSLGGTKLTLLLRRPPTPSTNSSLAALLAVHPHIATLTADIVAASESQLAALFAPFHTVVSCTGMLLPAGTQLKVARAVLLAATDNDNDGNRRANGVQRYFPWQFGVDYERIGPGSAQDLFTEQLGVRALLRAQERVRWLVLSTGVFASFLLGEAFGVVSGWDEKGEEEKEKEGGETGRGGEGGEGEGAKGEVVVRALGSWTNTVTATAVGDIAAAVAELALVDVEREGVAYMAGQTVAYGQVADAVEERAAKVHGRTTAAVRRVVRREVWDVPMLKRELEKEPGDGLKKYRVVFAEGEGVAWSEEGTLGRRWGWELMGLEEWVQEYLR